VDEMLRDEDTGTVNHQTGDEPVDSGRRDALKALSAAYRIRVGIAERELPMFLPPRMVVGSVGAVLAQAGGEIDE